MGQLLKVSLCVGALAFAAAFAGWTASCRSQTATSAGGTQVSFHNDGPKTIWIAVHYVPVPPPAGGAAWQTAGWYQLNAGERKYLFTTRNSVFYFTAHSRNNECQWSGTRHWRVLPSDPHVYGFREQRIDTTQSTVSLGLTSKPEQEQGHDALRELFGKDADLSELFNSKDVPTNPEQGGEEGTAPERAGPPPSKPRSLGVTVQPAVVNPPPAPPRRPGEEQPIGPGAEPPMEGLRVVAVFPGSPAQRAGLKAGDVIINAGVQQPDADDTDYASTFTRDLASLKAVLAKARNVVWLSVLRQGRYGDTSDIKVVFP